MSSRGEREIIELLRRIAEALEAQVPAPKTSSRKRVVETKEEE